MLPKELQTFRRLTNALQPEGTEPENKAAWLAWEILKAWRIASFPGLETGVADSSMPPQAMEFVAWLSNGALLESAFWLSSAYALWSGPSYRSSNAMFFTPPRLADEIIVRLLKHGATLKERWYDPAAGGAAFLVPLALKMASELRKEGASPDTIVAQIASGISGNELDATLADMARQFVEMALYTEIMHSQTALSLSITVGDGLITTPKSLHDVTICNPPYRKLSRSEQDQYRETFGSVISGQSNLYGLFILKCFDTTRLGGKVGILSPTSYLSGQVFAQLREKLTEQGHLAEVNLIREREGVFLGVQQETGFYVWTKNGRSEARGPTNVYSKNRNEKQIRIGTCFVPKTPGPWPIPRLEHDSVIIQTAEKFKSRVLDYGFTPRVGAYVHFRDKRKTHIERPQCLKKNTVPLIWPTDIKRAGMFHSSQPSDNRPSFIDVSDTEHPSVVRRPYIALQRVTSPDQPRRIIAAPWDPGLTSCYGGAVFENHVIVLEQTTSGPISIEEFITLITSAEVDRMYRCISGSVNVSLYELSNIPLPDPHEFRLTIDTCGSVKLAIQALYGTNLIEIEEKKIEQ